MGKKTAAARMKRTVLFTGLELERRPHDRVRFHLKLPFGLEFVGEVTRAVCIIARDWLLREFPLERDRGVVVPFPAERPRQHS